MQTNSDHACYKELSPLTGVCMSFLNDILSVMKACLSVHVSPTDFRCFLPPQCLQAQDF